MTTSTQNIKPLADFFAGQIHIDTDTHIDGIVDGTNINVSNLLDGLNTVAKLVNFDKPVLRNGKVCVTHKQLSELETTREQGELAKQMLRQLTFEDWYCVVTSNDGLRFVRTYIGFRTVGSTPLVVQVTDEHLSCEMQLFKSSPAGASVRKEFEVIAKIGLHITPLLDAIQDDLATGGGGHLFPNVAISGHLLADPNNPTIDEMAALVQFKVGRVKGWCNYVLCDQFGNPNSRNIKIISHEAGLHILTEGNGAHAKLIRVLYNVPMSKIDQCQKDYYVAGSTIAAMGNDHAKLPLQSNSKASEVTPEAVTLEEVVVTDKSSILNYLNKLSVMLEAMPDNFTFGDREKVQELEVINDLLYKELRSIEERIDYNEEFQRDRDGRTESFSGDFDIRKINAYRDRSRARSRDDRDDRRDSRRR